MKPYHCRAMKKGDPKDRRGCQALCERAQQDLWTGIRAPIRWSLEVWERIQNMHPIVALDGDRVVGFLLMAMLTHREPPTVQINTLTTLYTLPHRERLGVGLSLLLSGYEDCVAAGIKRGEGTVVAPNTVMLDTLHLVERFRIEVLGREPATPLLTERKPHVYSVEIEPVDEDYRAALEKALGAL